MTALAKQPPKMTSDEFLIWAHAQPEGRYELVRGEVVHMQSELVRHAVVKGNIYRALQDAVRAGKLPCQVFPDGVSVKINDEFTYQPDAALQCGVSVDLDALKIEAPMVVVEVTSPTSAKTDSSSKMADYFTVQTIRHVLIVDPLRKRILKHTRTPSNGIVTHILNVGDALTLEPPGLQIAVTDCFVET
jgi:Uma2 family endonuclease